MATRKNKRLTLVKKSEVGLSQLINLPSFAFSIMSSSSSTISLVNRTKIGGRSAMLSETKFSPLSLKLQHGGEVQ